jgi:hypothetical protein
MDEVLVRGFIVLLCLDPFSVNKNVFTYNSHVIHQLQILVGYRHKSLAKINANILRKCSMRCIVKGVVCFIIKKIRL